MAYDWRKKYHDKRPAEVAILEVLQGNPAVPFRPTEAPLLHGRRCQDCARWRDCRPVIGARYALSGFCHRPDISPKFPPAQEKRR